MHIRTSFSLISGSESESSVMTDGQSASLPWNGAPMWGLRPDLYYCHTVACLLMWALSLTWEWVCRLQLLLALASAVILVSECLGTLDHILLSQIRDSPFPRLLRLARLRWRYSTPPPHGIPPARYGFTVTQRRGGQPKKMFSNIVSKETSVYHLAMVFFPRIYLHGNVFTEPLLSSGWVLDCDWRLACRRYVVANGARANGVGAAVISAERPALDRMWVAPNTTVSQLFAQLH
jgi:hypothetical protein